MDMSLQQGTSSDRPTEDKEPTRWRGSVMATVTAASGASAPLDGLVIVDERGRVHDWNAAAEQLFGSTRAEALGTPIARYLPSENVVDRSVTHAAGLGGSDPVDTFSGERRELAARTGAGEELQVEVTSFDFGLDDLRYRAISIRDITEQRHLREELDLSKQRFEVLVEGASDVISMVDRDGSWTYTSQAGVRQMGYQKGFNPEHGLLSLVHPDDVPIVVAALEAVLPVPGTIGSPIQCRVFDVDGQVHWFESIAVNMIDNPAVDAVVIYSRDVTDRHEVVEQLQHRSQQLNTVLDLAGSGILIEQGDGTVFYVNDAFKEMMCIEQPREQIMGRDGQWIHEHIASLAVDPHEYMRAHDSRRSITQPTTYDDIRLADGRVLKRDCKPILKDGELQSVLWWYWDLSSEHEALEEREEMLERERDAREVIEQQNAALIKLNELENQLVATVSHEIRTPLTAVVSLVDLLDDEGTGPLNETQQGFVDTLGSSADRLMTLVDDLLLLARLESATMQLRLVERDVRSVVRDVAPSFEVAAQSKSIKLDVRLPEYRVGAVVDAARVSQVVTNLLGNAIKYTNDGGSVTIELDEARDGWSLVVTDTGIGIPSDELDGVFERFARASNARRCMIEGSGLGLAVTTRIVELHGGTISVESEEGEGSAFTVRIPRMMEDA